MNQIVVPKSGRLLTRPACRKERAQHWVGKHVFMRYGIPRLLGIRIVCYMTLVPASRSIKNMLTTTMVEVRPET